MDRRRKKMVISDSSEMSNSCDSESEEDVQMTPKRKRFNNYKHKYKKIWENKFSWLKESKQGVDKFYCKVCLKDLRGGYSSVERHNARASHIDKMKSIITQPTNLFQKSLQVGEICRKVKEAEIRLSAFIMEHNLPLASAEHLCQVIKTIDPDSKVLSQLTLGRTKATAIVTNVIGAQSHEEILNILKSTHTRFSLTIDESTDRSKTKHLAMVARFVVSDVVQKQFNTKDVFLALIEVDKADAVTLYQKIVDFFNLNQIDYKNKLIGFASDGANVMVGRKNSVTALLKKDIPTLFEMKCICHSLALCVSYASKKIPDEVEDLLRETYSYLSHSSKRLLCAAEFQTLLNVKPHKLLKLYDIRWLSLNECIARFLEQLPALRAFFNEESKTNTDAKRMFEKIYDPYIILYLKFLNNVLPSVVKRNIEFQSEDAKITELYAKMESMYLAILGRYLKDDYLNSKSNDVAAISNNNPANYVKLEDLDLGVLVEEELTILSQTSANLKHINVFRVKCLNFLIELAGQIYTRFPFADDNVRGLKYLNFLNPTVLKTTKNLAGFTTYMKKFIDIDSEDTDREYKEFKIYFKENTIIEEKAFWYKVETTRDGSGNLMFPIMVKIAKFIFTLPHSSASCERIFSSINKNKTKDRCSLGTATLTGILNGA